MEKKTWIIKITGQDKPAIFENTIALIENGTLTIMDRGLVAAYAPGVWEAIVSVNDAEEQAKK